MRRLPQGSWELSQGEPVHSKAAPDHSAGQLHRDQGEQLPEEEGGRRRRRAHQGGLLWRQASGGQAWHEAQVREISPVHTVSPSILSYLYSNSIATNNTYGQKFQKVENDENRFFAITSSKLFKN